MLYTLSGYRPVDPDEPVVHVSYYEANAFASWSEARLPTEQEWEAVAVGSPEPHQSAIALHPAPPALGPTNEPAQLYGDVWQWTSSSYLPYPGFRPEPDAVGEYNSRFMVGRQVLRGGASITPPGHTRATYRSFYPPEARGPLARNA
jgi:formylglycine-generating enzyme required for sulfatase activity